MPFRAPNPEHPLYGPFWRDAPEGTLRLPECTACASLLWPPAEVCPQCLASAIVWREVPGDGTAWSVAEYHRGYSAGLAAEVPYLCALVELDCGPRLIARCVGDDPVVAGSRVRTTRIREDGYSLPCFVAAPEPGSSSE